MRALFMILIVILCLSTTAAAYPPWSIGLGRVCEEGVSQLRLYLGSIEDPGIELPVSATVVRTTLIPGFDEPVLVTTEAVPMVEPGGWETVILDEPQYDDDVLGYYEVYSQWADGSERLEDTLRHSCDEPYLIRGRLLDDSTVEPCTGIGLLECTSVDIADLEFLQYVGTGQYVDIYGYPIWVESVSNCGVAITNVIPVPEGEGCEGVVATEARSWSAVKSLYR